MRPWVWFKNFFISVEVRKKTSHTGLRQRGLTRCKAGGGALKGLFDCGASSCAPLFFVQPLFTEPLPWEAAWQRLNGLHRTQAHAVLKAAGGSTQRAALAHALAGRPAAHPGRTAFDLAFFTLQMQQGARLLQAADVLVAPSPSATLLRRLALEHAHVGTHQGGVKPPQLSLAVTLNDLVQQLQLHDDRSDKISLIEQWLARADASQITQAQSAFMADAALRSLWQNPSVAGHPKGAVHTRQAALARQQTQPQKQSDAAIGQASKSGAVDRRPLDAQDLATEQAAVNTLTYGQWVAQMPALLNMLRRYDDNLLRCVRDQAPSAADWQQAKAGLLAAGVYVPPDARLDLVLPYKPIVLSLETSTGKSAGLEVAGTHQPAHPMTLRDAALLARASPRDEWTRRIGYSAYPEELHRTLVWASQNPLQALQEAYPELTQAQLQKIMLNPQEKYPRVGVEPVLSSVNLGFDKNSGFVRQPDGSMVIPAAVVQKKFHPKRDTTRKTDGQTAPRFVFRGDKRKPHEVQQAGGLYGHSNNASLGMHIFNAGRVPYIDRHSSSAFVSFTGDFYVAARFAASGLFSSSQAHYIYVVQPGPIIAKDVAMPGGGKLGFSGTDENEFSSFGCGNGQIVGYYELRAVQGGAHISPLLDYTTGQPVPVRKHSPRDRTSPS
jgi:hypothetical protein